MSNVINVCDDLLWEDFCGEDGLSVCLSCMFLSLSPFH